MNKFHPSSVIGLIFIIGLLIRILFLLFGAEIYFGRPDFYIDGDTGSYIRSIRNLIEHGVYTADPNHPDGYFLRTPGYPLFIGLFYFFAGKNLALTYQLIIWAQVMLDACCIIIIYKIGQIIFKTNKPALLIALLYATYPFIIVWNPVVYAESISVFFLLIGVLSFLNKRSKYHYFFSGVFIGFALLIRPQLIVVIPGYLLGLAYMYRHHIRNFIKPSLFVVTGVLLIYLPWPLRNYIKYNRIVLTQNYGSAKTLSPDVVAFWNYIFALKAEWEPQYSNILHNKKVTFPDEAYIVEGDSAKLEKAIYLSKTCGSGFSVWKGYWKKEIFTNNCDQEIATLFNDLRDNQIKYNSLNYYILVPLKNLKKSLFKCNFYNQYSTAKKLASILFFYRTVLIIAGLTGLLVIIISNRFHKFMPFAIIISTYVAVWYLYMAFVHRNIEIRYFLQADVLLLFPAGYLIGNIYRMFSEKVIHKP